MRLALCDTKKDTAMKECSTFEDFKGTLDIERRSQDGQTEADPAKRYHYETMFQLWRVTKRQNGCRACGTAWIVLHLCLNWISFMIIKFNPEALDPCKIQGLFSLYIKVMSFFFDQQITSIPVMDWRSVGVSSCCMLHACWERLTNTWFNMNRWMIEFPGIWSDNETANDFAGVQTVGNEHQTEFAHGFIHFAKICS